MSTEPRLRIGLAQLNFLVGDAQGNAARVIDSVTRAGAGAGAKPDLMVFPELTLSGYPPEDLLFHGGFRQAIDRALATVRDAVRGTGVIVGYPEYVGHDIYNSAAFLRDGRLVANHRKQELPNYKVFDEKRYFRAGSAATVFEHQGFRIGLLVCEDVWEAHAARQAREAGAELLIIINALPFEVHKQSERERVVRARVTDVRLPVAYVNMLGGQDELVFDGNSFVMDAQGTIVMRAPGFTESTCVVEFVRTEAACAAPAGAGGGGAFGRRHRVPRAGAGCARLRDQAWVPRRGDGAVRWRRLRADAGHRCRRLGAAARPRRHDALALHLADEPGRCGRCRRGGWVCTTA